MKNFLNRAVEQFKQDAGITKSIKLEYVGGHPDIRGKEITIVETKKQNVVKINGKECKVDRIEWEEKFKRSLGKAAVGVVAGGLLTGGIGAIAGGVIGAKRKNTSTAVIVLESDEANSSLLLVRCNEKDFKELSYLL
jgi:hypothetical protein